MFNCFSFADTRNLLKSSVDCELDCTTKADPLIMFTWCSLNTNWSESLQETKRRHEWAQDSDHVLHLCGEILMLSRNKQKPAAAEKKKCSLRSKTFLARDPVRRPAITGLSVTTCSTKHWFFYLFYLNTFWAEIIQSSPEERSIVLPVNLGTLFTFGSTVPTERESWLANWLTVLNKARRPAGLD